LVVLVVFSLKCAWRGDFQEIPRKDTLTPQRNREAGDKEQEKQQLQYVTTAVSKVVAQQENHFCA